MPYLLIAAYTHAALKALGEHPSDRGAAAEKLIVAAGGKMVSFYRTLSDGPGVHIVVDADPIAAAAITATAVASGALTDVKFSKLWTDEGISAMCVKRTEIEGSYKPPA